MDKETKRFTQHAQKFGTDSVLEAAHEEGLSVDQLVALQTELDKIDATPKSRFVPGIKHRLSARTRVERYLGIEKEEAAA